MSLFTVIPAEAGIQFDPTGMDPGFRRGDVYRVLS
jgi:hypothetical protein